MDMKSSCPVVVHFDKGVFDSKESAITLANEIKLALEVEDDDYDYDDDDDTDDDDDHYSNKIDAMKNAIILLLNGETTLLLELFTTVVRVALPSAGDQHDLTLLKLILLYIEIIDKTDDDDFHDIKDQLFDFHLTVYINRHLSFYLHHKNEYVRGVTLRFLSRVNEPDLVLHLIPSIIFNLNHPHPYVRRNALLALTSTYNKTPCIESLAILRLVCNEKDASAKRNAFVMLSSCLQHHAISYLLSNADNVSDWGELLQMAVLDLIRKLVVENQETEREKYIRIVVSLMNNPSSAASVVYECAGTLVSLMNNSSTDIIRAAADKYCQLLLSQSDNIAKLVLLDRLNDILKSSYSQRRDDIIIDVDMIMDALIKAPSSSIDVRRKTLDIILELITLRNINRVVLTLTKEFVKHEKNDKEYGQMLVQAIDSCSIKFPGMKLIHSSMDFFLGNAAGALRDLFETNSKVRARVATRFLRDFNRIRVPKYFPGALWIIGEFCLSLSEVEGAIAIIMQSLGGNLPFFPLSEAKSSTTSGNLRSLLLSGNFPVGGAVVACTLAKLVLRLGEIQPSKVEVEKATRNALSVMESMLQIGRRSMDKDSCNGINSCIRLLRTTGDAVTKIWLNSCRGRSLMLSDKQLLEETEEIITTTAHQVTTCYHYYPHPDDDDLCHPQSLKLAATTTTTTKDADDDDANNTNKLNHIIQLTGFSDPVYVEANVRIHHDYNNVVEVDIKVINRTTETLENLCLELATTTTATTMGDEYLTKLVECQNYNSTTVVPESSKMIKANIKSELESDNDDETGFIIFGNIVYQTSSSNNNNVLDRTHVVVLNDIYIYIDIKDDYISPPITTVCSHTAFRTIWAELNKVVVNTTITNEKGCLDNIIRSTNMKYLAAISPNLFAKSIRGDDAFLVKGSVEKKHTLLDVFEKLSLTLSSRGRSC